MSPINMQYLPGTIIKMAISDLVFISLLHGGNHVGTNDTWLNFKDYDALGGQALCVNLSTHA